MKNNKMITGCLCGVSLLATAVSCRKSEDKPNILFILADDQRADALVYLFDLYPTLAELSHLPSPEDIDGKSLVPVISGKSLDVRSSLFTAYRNTVRAVRTKEWKLIRYPERDYNQLFNLVSDPLEMNNLAGEKKYLPKVDELFKVMKDWQITVKDTVPLISAKIFPPGYDHTKLVRKPDQWQPDYTLRKYFGTEPYKK